MRRVDVDLDGPPDGIHRHVDPNAAAVGEFEVSHLRDDWHSSPDESVEHTHLGMRLQWRSASTLAEHPGELHRTGTTAGAQQLGRRHQLVHVGATLVDHLIDHGDKIETRQVGREIERESRPGRYDDSVLEPAKVMLGQLGGLPKSDARRHDHLRTMPSTEGYLGESRHPSETDQSTCGRTGDVGRGVLHRQRQAPPLEGRFAPGYAEHGVTDMLEHSFFDEALPVRPAHADLAELLGRDEVVLLVQHS